MRRHWTASYRWPRPMLYRLLDRLGFENAAADRERVTEWMRPHPNDTRGYSTRRALWIALTGRARRGGFNASWAIWKEGR